MSEASKTKITTHECQTAVLLAVLFKLSAQSAYVCPVKPEGDPAKCYDLLSQ